LDEDNDDNDDGQVRRRSVLYSPRLLGLVFALSHFRNEITEYSFSHSIALFSLGSPFGPVEDHALKARRSGYCEVGSAPPHREIRCSLSHFTSLLETLIFTPPDRFPLHPKDGYSDR